ncbi:hypothetical protein ACHWQZ_G003000 [Mnemiopsis leidyi]
MAVGSTFNYLKMVVTQKWGTRHKIGLAVVAMLVIIATVVGVVATRNSSSHTPLQENCTGLPFTWDPHLTTKLSGSVAPGEKLTLSCQGDDTFNVGDDKVTCIGGTEYKYDVQPKCQVIRGELDGRKYRPFTLPNKIRVTLVSDPETELSAVNLRIQAGSWVNPKEIPGLMHYLEHMVFLGSTRYPGASEYVKYISDNGGKRNGATGLTYTYYYFKIFNHAKTKAAKMLSSFISNPLLAADKLTSAVNAVNSEYVRNFGKNSRTTSQLMYLSASPDHPYNGYEVVLCFASDL